MERSASTRGFNPLLRGANWLAAQESLPTSIRAVCGYYSEENVFDYRALKLKSYVDREVDDIIESAYAIIEEEIATEFDVADVEFDYNTKLTLPAELTLGYLYRRILEESPSNFNPITGEAERNVFDYARVFFGRKRHRRRDERSTEKNRELIEEVEKVERVTGLVIEALIDGDMRDALNDREYADFRVSLAVDSKTQKRRVAEIAQRTLQNSIEKRLSRFPDSVEQAYRTAVEISERHQAEDVRFRELMERDDRASVIQDEYKFGEFESPPDLFGQDVLSLPYFKTQYDRVGVIYDGMIDMYRGAGFTFNDNFKRSIILAIIGAQIWLDDVTDYSDDLEEGQLTPVTAEYILADSDADAYDNVVNIAGTYLEYAKSFAADSGTPMTGIAVEYIYREGDPDHLPQ